MKRNGLAGAWTVFRKELLETLRDKRTLAMMILVPVLLYPGVFIIFEQLTIIGIESVTAQPARVVVRGGDPALLEYLAGRDDVQLVTSTDNIGPVIRNDLAQAVAVIRPSSDEGTARASIYYDGANDRSVRARGVLADALAAWNDTLLVRRLAARSLPPTFARPIAVRDSSIAQQQAEGSRMLGRFMPLLLVLITLLGAFYPAIDLAAGEKERGTLETLLLTPTPSWQIITGKFATVAVVGVAAASLNLTSMMLTLRLGLFTLPESVGIVPTLPIWDVLLIFATLVPLSVLFAGLFLGLAVRAHSFKEAQNALTPIYILVLIPAMVPLIPGIQLTPMMATVPVAGVALLFRELLSGTATLGPALIALAASAGYAGVALAFAAHSFGREDIVFGADDAVPATGIIASIKRLGRPVAALPTTKQAVGFILAIVLLYFYGGRLIAGLLAGENVLLATLAAQWALLFIPTLLFLMLSGVDGDRTLSLFRPKPRQALGALLLIAGGLPVAWGLSWLQTFVLPVPEAFMRGFQELLTAQTPAQLAFLLLVVSLTPAVCEEFVFRGVFLSGFNKSPTRTAVLVNALVFGAFHLSYQTIIRFLPTAWLGLLLAWTVRRTGSIWLSTGMHALNNAMLLFLAMSPTALGALGTESQAPRWWVVVLAILALAAGYRLIVGVPVEDEDVVQVPAAVAALPEH